MGVRHKILAALIVGGTLFTQLAGCGGGGGGGSASPGASSNTASGTASKGLLNGSTVCAYAITGGAKGSQIGTCTKTSSTGTYTIDLGSHTGPVLFEASGGSYIDEATGSSVALTMPLHGFLISAASGENTAAISALTELAYELASAASGGLTAANLQSAATVVQTNFGITDIVATQPVDALTLPASATPEQKAYALALATISQHQSNTSATLSNTLNDIKACLASVSNCGTLSADLATAMSSFQGRHAGYAGIHLPASGFGGSGTGGNGSLSCNTAHYQAGAVHLPTSAELTSFAKTYAGNTGSYNNGSWTSNGGTASFVLGSTGGLTYNGKTQTVNSVCADNNIAMLYVEFGGTGMVDFFADGAFNGNLPDLTGVNGSPGGGGTTNPSGISLTAKSSGIVAADIASMVGHYAMPVGVVGGASSTVSDCTFDVASNGSFTLAGGGHVYTASVLGTYAPVGVPMGNILVNAPGVANVTAHNASSYNNTITAAVQNGYVVQVAVSSGTTQPLICAFPNPSVSTAGGSDVTTMKFATASNMSSTRAGTYRNADNCTLTINTGGSFHFTMPAASTLTATTSTNKAVAIDVSTVLGGDYADKISFTPDLGAGSVFVATATEKNFLIGNLSQQSITFDERLNLGGMGGGSLTVTYLDSPDGGLSASTQVACSNMVKQ